MKNLSILTTKEVKFEITYENGTLKISLEKEKISKNVKNAVQEIYEQIKGYVSALKKGYRKVLYTITKNESLIEEILDKLVKWNIEKEEIEQVLKEKHAQYVLGYVQEKMFYEENKIQKVWFIPFSEVFSVEISPEKRGDIAKFFKVFPSSNSILYPTPVENQKVMVTMENLIDTMNKLKKIERKHIFEILKATLKIFREQKYEETREAFQFETRRRLSVGTLTPSNFKTLSELIKNISVLSETRVFSYETILPIIWYYYLSQRGESET